MSHLQARPSRHIETDRTPGGGLAVRTIRTLIIEDSEFDRKRTLRVCAETGLDFKTTMIEGLETLRTHLDAQKFDLALVDYRLSDSNGLDAVRRIRSHPAQVNAAILMLTGEGDMSLAIDAMKAGCSDFLEKGHLNAAALRRATLNAMEKSLLHQDLMRARGLNDKLAAMMRDFAHETSSEMKPIILDMMRRTRATRRGPFGNHPPGAVELDAACRKLWAMVEAMEDTADKI